MPYVALSIAHSTLSETGRAAEYARRAYVLRGKVSERERLSIEATYYLDTTGQLDKAAEIYEIWHRVYPRDRVPYSSLPFIYGSLGQYDKALQEAQEILRLNPNNEANYNNVCAALINLNRFEDAEKVYKRAEEGGLAGEHLLSVRYSLDFFSGDRVGMEQVVAKSKVKPGYEHWLLAAQERLVRAIQGLSCAYKRSHGLGGAQ
jgi:tetratricopeptide (TPR) repeat protein